MSKKGSRGQEEKEKGVKIYVEKLTMIHPEEALCYLEADELYSCLGLMVGISSSVRRFKVDIGVEIPMTTEKLNNRSFVLFDMETGDPDDILSLYLLLGHPSVEVVAVTIHPGTPDQIGLIREVLADMQVPHIPVGYHNINHEKICVSRWYYKNGFQVVPSTDAVPAGQLILDLTTSATTIVTGGPLTNIASAIRLGQRQNKPFQPLKLTIQGGYAGCNIVPDSIALEKFRGLVEQHTYNLGGNREAAYTVLSQIPTVPKYFVSKNVCHGIVYTDNLADQLLRRCRLKPARHLIRIFNLLEHYHAYGIQKKLHDPFAVCCSICPDIVEWKQVHMYANKGAWRSEDILSEKSQGRGITISTEGATVITTLKPFLPRDTSVDGILQFPNDSRDNMTWICVGLRSYDDFLRTLLS